MWFLGQEYKPVLTQMNKMQCISNVFLTTSSATQSTNHLSHITFSILISLGLFRAGAYDHECSKVGGGSCTPV